MNIEQLQKSLTLQLSNSQQLLELLGLENQALVERYWEKILELANQKQQLLQQLGEADDQLRQQLPQGTVLPEELVPLKDKITNNIAQAQQQNATNGKAIDLSLGSLDRLQRSLIQRRAGNSMTYNEKGKTRASSLKGGFISA